MQDFGYYTPKDLHPPVSYVQGVIYPIENPSEKLKQLINTKA